MEGDDVTVRRLLTAIIATGCCLLTNVPTGVATGPIETYQNWSDDLKSYTQTVCDEYDVDYSLALGVIYNESRFQSSLTHLNSNGTTDYGLMQVNEIRCTSCLMIVLVSDVEFSYWHIINSTLKMIRPHFFDIRLGQGSTSSI